MNESNKSKYIEEYIDKKISLIEYRLKKSFQLIKSDIKKINNSIKSRDNNSADNSIYLLKEKLKSRFSELDLEINNLKENVITKGIFTNEKIAFDEKFSQLCKDVTKFEESIKEQEQIKKEMSNLKNQVNLLKSRVNIIQSEITPKSEDKSTQEIDKKNIKKLPFEDVKYNKDGVKSNFISKIIDSLSED